MKYRLLFSLIILVFTLVFTTWSASALTRQIPASGRLETPNQTSVPDGNYTMRFSIYSVNRTTADPFPSDADSGSRLWTETQTVAVSRGIWRTTLGNVTALPATLNFDSGDYFLGIRVNTDPEMVPRKKILPVPLAIDSESVGGATPGTIANNVLKLDGSGNIDIAGNITSSGVLQGSNLIISGSVTMPVSSLLLGTTSTSFVLGNATALAGNNFSLAVSSTANKPALRYNGSTNKWEVSNDGTTFSDILISAAAGITSLNGLTGTTQTFANDTNITITSSGTTHTLGWSGTLPVSRGGSGTGTAFTAGSVVFAGASGVYTQDNANFFWDDSTNRLGIATASPQTTLALGSGALSVPVGSVSAPSYTFAGDLNTGLYWVSADDLAVTTGGANRLSISNAAVTSLVQFIAASGSAGTPGIAFASDGNTGFWSPGGGVDIIGISTNGAERARIDAVGNFGINTTSPTARFQVQGGTTSSGAVTMTASNGATTFTTSSSVTLNVGDYVVPTTTTAQARSITVGGTGTSFTVTPAFSADVIAETYTVYRPITNFTDNSGNTSLFLQGNTKYVGLGTANPLSQLHIDGSAINIGQIQVNTGTRALTISQDNAAATLDTNLGWNVQTDGATRLNVSDNQAWFSGRVGIGTTDRLSKLTVVGQGDQAAISGTTTANATTTITGSSTNFLQEVGIGDRIALSSAPSTYATVTAIASGTSLTVDTALGDGTSQTIAVKHSSLRVENSANAVQLVVNDQGNVGIGTVNPSANLTITRTGTTPIVTIINGSTHRARLDIGSAGFDIGVGGSGNAGSLRLFATTNASCPTGCGSDPQAILNNFGNFGIGTGATAPTARLQAQGGSTSSGSTTMTASNGASTFTTSASITINAGDYIIPTTTTGQARAVTVGGTGTSFTVSPAFTADVTAETFTIYQPIAHFVDNGGNTKFIIQGSTGAVGMGTLVPNPLGTANAALLHSVAANGNWVIESPLGANNEAYVYFSKTGEGADPKWAIGRSTWGSSNADTLRIIEDDLEANTRLSIMAGGNVGIGTATPRHELQVGAGGASGNRRISVVANNAASASLKLTESDGTTESGFNINYDGGSDVLNIYGGSGTYASDPSYASSPFLSILRASGNVGIGTATPSERLEVVGGGNVLQTAATPTAKAGIDLADELGNYVYISGRYAYVTKDVNAGVCSGVTLTGCEFSIYDVSNPSAPAAIGGVDLNVIGNRVVVSGRYAYVTKNVDAGTCSGVTLTGCEFSIYDVSNPASPAAVGGVDLGQFTYDVFISGHYAYIAKNVDAGVCSGVTLTGCEFSIYDVSNPASPAAVGGVDLSADGTTVYVVGRFAYVGKSTNAGVCSGVTLTGCEMSIYDISNPSAPSAVGGMDLASTSWSSAVSGRYAYIGKGTNVGVCSGVTLTGCEFSIYDVSNPASPAAVGGVDLGITAWGLNIAGRYAYIAKGVDAGTCSGTTLTGCEISVYDVLNPASPVAKGGVDLGVIAWTINVSGHYAYIGKNPQAGTCSGTTVDGCEFSIYDISGIETTSLLAHSLEAGNLQVRNDLLLQGQLQVAGGANFGPGGIMSSGQLGINSGAYFNGNVGVGTTSPNANLDVRGSIQIESASGNDPTVRGHLEIHQQTNGANVFWAHRQTDTGPTGNFIQFQNAALTSDLFSVDVTGTALIGNTSLGVSISNYTIGQTGNDSNLFVSAGLGAGNLTLRPGNTGAIYVQLPNNTPLITALSSGNVGIGTLTPTQKLTVDQGIVLQTSGGTPTTLSGIDTASGVLGSYISGKYAYVGNDVIAGTCSGATLTGCEFRIYDISNPSSPSAVGGVDIGTLVYSIVISGKYAYITNGGIGGTCSGTTLTGCEFRIYDISNPSSPTAVSGIDTTTYTTAVYVSGKYVYIGSGGVAGACSSSDLTGCEVRIYDISNPFVPAVVGGLDLTVDAYSISVSGKYLYIGNSTIAGTCSGATVTGCEFRIYDISNPSSPAAVGGIDIGTYINSHYISGKYAYIANNTIAGTCSGTTLTGCEFRIYDISTPSAPVAMSGVDFGSSQSYVYVVGKYAYIGQGSAVGGTCSSSDQTGCEFRIYDISNASSPTGVGGVDTALAINSNIVSGKYAYLGSPTVAGTCSGATVTGCEFRIVDLPGLDASNANIGSIASNTLNVSENAIIKNSLTVETGINVGVGGIQSQGPVSILSLTAGTSGAALDVRNSAGASLLFVRDDGNIGLGITSGAAKLNIQQDTTSALLTMKDGANNTVATVFDGGASTFRSSAFDTVYTFDGVTTYSDNTAEAKTSEFQAGNTAFTVLALEGSSNDEFYLGLDHPFARAYMDIATAGVGVTLSAQYWNGAWTALAITDSTTNLTVDGAITFTDPADWVTTAVNGTTKYWIRLRSPATNITTAPTASVVSAGNTYAFRLFGQSGDTNPSLTVNTEGEVLVALSGAASTAAICGSHGTATSGNLTNVMLTDCSGAPAADYAEMYPVAKGIDFGDIVATGVKSVQTKDGDNIVQLIKSNTPYQSNVIGIVSDNFGDFTSAGYNVNSEDNPKPVALSGRVPAKVTLENGPIAVGDYLTSSSTPGAAMKAKASGFVIGKALEAFSGPGEGKVMIFVEPGWRTEPAVYLTQGGEAALTSVNTGLLATKDLEVSGLAQFHGDIAVAGKIRGDLNVEGVVKAGQGIVGGWRSYENHFLNSNFETDLKASGAGTASWEYHKVILATSPVAGSVVQIDHALNFRPADDAQGITWRFMVRIEDESDAFRLGLFRDEDNRATIEKGTSPHTAKFVTCREGVCETTDDISIDPASANRNYIIMIKDGEAKLMVDGTIYVTHSANVPSGSVLHFHADVSTAADASRSASLDYIGAIIGRYAAF